MDSSNDILLRTIYTNIEVIHKNTEYFVEHFKEWWDPNKFNWKLYSHYLPGYFSDYFSIWWDAEKINWNMCSGGLVINCDKYFDVWWPEVVSFLKNKKFEMSDIKYIINLLETHCQIYKKYWLDDVVKMFI